MGRFVLVGADPRIQSSHHGGVLTLSAGLVSYAQERGHVVEVINTLRREFDELPAWRRLAAGVRRAVGLLTALTTARCDGVIIFAGAGMSFYERILLSAICRLCRVTDLLIVVDGWFLETLRRRALTTRLLLKIPHKIAACGARWREAFLGIGVASARIVPIHFWLDESFKVAASPKEKPDRPIRFLFVGWMIREKGVHELLAAIRDLRKFHEFSVTLVGGGTLLEAVRHTISESGWSESVFAPGWVPAKKFEQLFDWADVFVLPSYAEGFPMSLIEAFSKGLPAICSDVGGISDSLRDGINGFLIPPRQVEPLRAAMARYINNPGLITEHSRAALDTVKANHNPAHNGELIFSALR